MRFSFTSCVYTVQIPQYMLVQKRVQTHARMCMPTSKLNACVQVKTKHFVKDSVHFIKVMRKQRHKQAHSQICVCTRAHARAHTHAHTHKTLCTLCLTWPQAAVWGHPGAEGIAIRRRCGKQRGCPDSLCTAGVLHARRTHGLVRGSGGYVCASTRAPLAGDNICKGWMHVCASCIAMAGTRQHAQVHTYIAFQACICTP